MHISPSKWIFRPGASYISNLIYKSYRNKTKTYSWHSRSATILNMSQVDFNIDISPLFFLGNQRHGSFSLGAFVVHSCQLPIWSCHPFPISTPGDRLIPRCWNGKRLFQKYTKITTINYFLWLFTQLNTTWKLKKFTFSLFSLALPLSLVLHLSFFFLLFSFSHPTFSLSLSHFSSFFSLSLLLWEKFNLVPISGQIELSRLVPFWF